MEFLQCILGDTNPFILIDLLFKVTNEGMRYLAQFVTKTFVKYVVQEDSGVSLFLYTLLWVCFHGLNLWLSLGSACTNGTYPI